MTRRIVENVPAAPWAAGITVVDHAAVDPGLVDFSFGCWFKLDPTKASILMEKYSGYGLMIYPSGGKIRLYTRDAAAHAADVTTAKAADDLNWHHILASVDRTNALLRIILDSEAEVTGAIGLVDDLSVVVNCYIGWASGGVYLRSWNDAVIWKGRCVTAVENADWYYNGKIPEALGATRHIWRAREGAGTAIASVSAGHAGTLSANSWTTDTRCHARTAA